MNPKIGKPSFEVCPTVLLPPHVGEDVGGGGQGGAERQGPQDQGREGQEAQGEEPGEQGCQVGLFEAKFVLFFWTFGLRILENLLSSWPFFQV